jgi:hypothetical protein
MLQIFVDEMEDAGRRDAAHNPFEDTSDLSRAE